MPDLRLPIGDMMFAIRAGILCVREGQLLVVAGDHLKFKYSPGGAVNVGEEAAQAAAREWREETGVAAGPLRLVGLVENFFELNGKPWHEIGFYYQMLWQGPALTVSWVADQPEERLEWLPLAKLAEERVYPAVIGELLDVPAGEIRHIVNRETPALARNQDLRFPVEDTELQVRAHLLYVQDGFLLTNTVPGSNVWFLPGGTVHLGEDSLGAALREWHEETGAKAKSARLVGIVEGFDAENHRQQLGLCSLIESAEKLSEMSFPVQDHDQLVMEWVPLDEMDSRPVEPRGIQPMLDVPAGEVVTFTVQW